MANRKVGGEVTPHEFALDRIVPVDIDAGTCDEISTDANQPGRGIN
jgi:hypothetical protein